MTTLLLLDHDTGLDLDRGLATEWLETNGLGDYASSTVFLCPTRRYHGLLVARFEGAEKRHVFLSRFEERARFGGLSRDFSMARYPDSRVPRGDLALRSFSLAPHPRATFEWDGIELVREIQLVRGRRVVLCRYSTNSGEPIELELRPFLPFREADALTVRNSDAQASPVGDGLAFRLYPSLPELTLSADVPLLFEPDAHWYERIFLEQELARGYPASEDHLSPGTLHLVLSDELVVAAGLDGPVADPGALWREEARRREKRWKAARGGKSKRASAAAARLAYHAEDFLYELDRRTGVVAGFPWFGEWGRDTFLSLPGLTLARGEVERCGDVLSRSLAYLKGGLLPNVFGRTVETSHYGSLDASLWFARAVEAYESAGGDAERLRDELVPALAEIAGAYWDGTELDVRADEGGLIRGGSPERNVTWMDARTPEGPVTPRHGCAVEVNALWYSLLRHLETSLRGRGDRRGSRLWRERRLRAKQSFLERFWLADENRLADLWRPDGVDRSLRPNMVIAAALLHSPLDRSQRRGVVEAADAKLLTPRGLRTLAPGSDGYRGRYEGGPTERDGAYHQGTVWPWLFGFHVEAWLRVDARRPVKDRLRATWNSIALELNRAGLGHVSEVFDGDPPHRPGGTIAQAWNTAELLRADRMLARGRA